MRMMLLCTTVWLAGAPSLAIGSTFGTFAITSGSGYMQLEGPAQFALFGRGISFTAEGSTWYSPCSGRHWGWERCVPGATVRLSDGLDSEEYMTGTVTINGVERSYGGWGGAINSARIELLFTLTLPSLGTNPQMGDVALSAPFTALAWVDIVQPVVQYVEMRGQGTATVHLRPVFEDELGYLYEYQSATYSFHPEIVPPQIVPEPSVLHLLGAGMALLIFKRWREL
jgi:hypothetical protein